MPNHRWSDAVFDAAQSWLPNKHVLLAILALLDPMIWKLVKPGSIQAIASGAFGTVVAAQVTTFIVPYLRLYAAAGMGARSSPPSKYRLHLGPRQPSEEHFLAVAIKFSGLVTTHVDFVFLMRELMVLVVLRCMVQCTDSVVLLLLAGQSAKAKVVNGTKRRIHGVAAQLVMEKAEDTLSGAVHQLVQDDKITFTKLMAHLLPLLPEIVLRLHLLTSVGLAHRDIKLSNLLMVVAAVATSACSGRMRLKLGDLGLARTLEDSDMAAHSATGIGTPVFWPLEAFVESLSMFGCTMPTIMIDLAQTGKTLLATWFPKELLYKLTKSTRWRVALLYAKGLETSELAGLWFAVHNRPGALPVEALVIPAPDSTDAAAAAGGAAAGRAKPQMRLDKPLLDYLVNGKHPLGDDQKAERGRGYVSLDEAEAYEVLTGRLQQTADQAGAVTELRLLIGGIVTAYHVNLAWEDLAVRRLVGTALDKLLSDTYKFEQQFLAATTKEEKATSYNKLQHYLKFIVFPDLFKEGGLLSGSSMWKAAGARTRFVHVLFHTARRSYGILMSASSRKERQCKPAEALELRSKFALAGTQALLKALIASQQDMHSRRWRVETAREEGAAHYYAVSRVVEQWLAALKERFPDASSDVPEGSSGSRTAGGSTGAADRPPQGSAGAKPSQRKAEGSGAKLWAADLSPSNVYAEIWPMARMTSVLLSTNARSWANALAALFHSPTDQPSSAIVRETLVWLPESLEKQQVTELASLLPESLQKGPREYEAFLRNIVANARNAAMAGVELRGDWPRAQDIMGSFARKWAQVRQERAASQQGTAQQGGASQRQGTVAAQQQAEVPLDDILRKLFATRRAVDASRLVRQVEVRQAIEIMHCACYMLSSDNEAVAELVQQKSAATAKPVEASAATGSLRALPSTVPASQQPKAQPARRMQTRAQVAAGLRPQLQGQEHGEEQTQAERQAPAQARGLGDQGRGRPSAAALPPVGLPPTVPEAPVSTAVAPSGCRKLDASASRLAAARAGGNAPPIDRLAALAVGPSTQASLAFGAKTPAAASRRAIPTVQRSGLAAGRLSDMGAGLSDPCTVATPGAASPFPSSSSLVSSSGGGVSSSVASTVPQWELLEDAMAYELGTAVATAKQLRTTLAALLPSKINRESLEESLRTYTQEVMMGCEAEVEEAEDLSVDGLALAFTLQCTLHMPPGQQEQQQAERQLGDWLEEAAKRDREVAERKDVQDRRPAELEQEDEYTKHQANAKRFRPLAPDAASSIVAPPLTQPPPGGHLLGPPPPGIQGQAATLPSAFTLQLPAGRPLGSSAPSATPLPRLERPLPWAPFEPPAATGASASTSQRQVGQPPDFAAMVQVASTSVQHPPAEPPPGSSPNFGPQSPLSPTRATVDPSTSTEQAPPAMPPLFGASAGSMTPAGQDGSVAPAGQDGSMTPAGQDGSVAPAGQDGSMTPAGQDGSITPAGQDGSMTPAGQDGSVAPAGQDGSMTPAGQDGSVTPAGQDGSVAELQPRRRGATGSRSRGQGYNRGTPQGSRWLGPGRRL